MDIRKIGNIQNLKDEAQKVAGQVQDQVTEISAAAQAQFDAVLNEYQKVLPVAEKLGLTVGDFNLVMGVLPEIRTSLVGAVDQIDNDAVKEMIEENQNNKILVTILNSLLLTKELQKRLHITNLKGIRVDAKLGISPGVSVHLLP